MNTCTHGWKTVEESTRGKCDDCDKQERSCTVCGKEVAGFERYIIQGVGCGHEECVTVKAKEMTQTSI